MAFALRAALQAGSIAILLAVLTNARVAAGQPAPREIANRVAPVARVDLGAPDARCPDLAYPLWDDGMCVRAKCADDDACEFSRVAGATTPAAPPGLAQERWRTATARPAISTSTRVAPSQFARAKDSRRAGAVPLLAEARAVDSRIAASRARSSERPARGGAFVAEQAADRASIWSRIRAALSRFWRRIQSLSRLFAPTENAAAPKGTS